MSGYTIRWLVITALAWAGGFLAGWIVREETMPEREIAASVVWYDGPIKLERGFRYICDDGMEAKSPCHVRDSQQ